MRIVDQALPADDGARLFKINAHDNFQAFGKFLAQGVEPRGIFQRALSSWTEHGPMTTSSRGSSRRKMRMIRSRLCATIALTASGVGDCAFSSRGVSSRTISLTCKSCVET